MMRYNQIILCIAALIWSYADTNAQSKTNSSKPNVIYIFADDLGYGELGSYGQKKIKTPNLDLLAKEGMRFTQHYTGTPVCAPARCNLMTGRHSGKAYIRGNYGLPGYEENKSETGQFPIPENTPTIATLFKQAGYATAAIGKWGLGNYGSSGDPLKHGFDLFYGYYDQRHAHNYYTTHLYRNGQWDTLANPVIDVHPKLVSDNLSAEDIKAYTGKEYAIDKMTSQALGFIEQNKSQSFFLYLPFTLPHAALQVPEEDVQYYINLFNEQPTYIKGGYTPVLYPLSTYAAMITYLDKQVGLIQEQLKKLGLDENTVILFSSDNGPASSIGVNNDFFNSAGSLKGRKQDVYEGGIREPFIARWPGRIPAGKVNPTISAQYDMMATFADLLKVPAPENDGVSLLPTLLGNDKNQKQHEFLYWEYPERGGQLAVRMGKWKGVKTDLLKNPQAKWQLYNLETDPKESNDVAEKHPELLKQFDTIVKKEHTKPVREEWNIFK